ncbi:MAG: hypothetical protein AB8B96_12055 [Lysobacterales bacterium]
MGHRHEPIAAPKFSGRALFIRLTLRIRQRLAGALSPAFRQQLFEVIAGVMARK